MLPPVQVCVEASAAPVKVDQVAATPGPPDVRTWPLAPSDPLQNNLCRNHDGSVKSGGG